MANGTLEKSSDSLKLFVVDQINWNDRFGAISEYSDMGLNGSYGA
jgi:hypothetical protein